MALTSIGTQKTPARPVEVTFAGETGLPSANQEVLLIGHKDAVSGSVAPYEITTIANSGDLVAASGEVATKFGAGSEMALMVLAAIKATQGLGTVPVLKCVPLDAADVDFGTGDEALITAGKHKAEYLVSPYGSDVSPALYQALRDTAIDMSGPQRVENNQFGTVGVIVNQVETDPSLLPVLDTQFLMGCWLPNSGTPDYTDAELAAACAARCAANVSPFNPLDDVIIGKVPAPAAIDDWITVGAGLESEACLNQGWTPLRVMPTGQVAFVRTVTGRLSPDGSGSPLVTAYYDLQDFNVLYFFRKAVYTRFAQPDFKQRKASAETGREIKSEVIRLMGLFEDGGMFQAVKELSKEVLVERNVSDRHRFDVKIPVNVVPGLHVLASNIEAGTKYDVITL
jgi:phage tail sheath gpL-like